MVDARNQEAGKAPGKETSDFAQSTEKKGAATEAKPKPEGKRPAEGRTPQAGR